MQQSDEVQRYVQSAETLLGIMRRGVEDYEEAGDRRFDGLYQAVSAARSVTQAIQRLRSRAEGFDEWWTGWRRKLADDPNSRFFWDLRTRLEKQGETSAAYSQVGVTGFSPSQLPPPPAGAVSAFIGDQLGRSGWRVLLASGDEATVFFKLDLPGISAGMVFEGMPEGRELDSMLGSYLIVITEIVHQARERFIRAEV